MKVSLCLTGNVRGFEKTKKAILSINGGDIDIFIHSWKNKCTGRIKNKSFGSTDVDKIRNLEYLDLNIFNNISYKKIKIEEQYNSSNLKYYDKVKVLFDNNELAFTALSQWYGMKECLKLKLEYEKENNIMYDIVIRSTFDILPLINITSMSDRTIYITNEKYCSNDRLVMGPNEGMNLYLNIFNNIENLLNNEENDFNGLNPEKLLLLYLKYNDINVVKTNDLKYDFLRDTNA